MKKSSTNHSVPVSRNISARRRFSEGGFFDLRILICLLIITTGLSLALFAVTPVGSGAAASTAGKAQQKHNPAGSSIDLSVLPPGFDCSKVHEKGIDLIGPLPADIQHITVFSAAVPSKAAQPDAAKALVKFLTAPAQVPTIKKHGLDPA